jgi:hypothetical protein
LVGLVYDSYGCRIGSLTTFTVSYRDFNSIIASDIRRGPVDTAAFPFNGPAISRPPVAQDIAIGIGGFADYLGFR